MAGWPTSSTFTEETWRESRVNASWSVTGHTERLRNRERISEGDTFIRWVTGVSALAGDRGGILKKRPGSLSH